MAGNFSSELKYKDVAKYVAVCRHQKFPPEGTVIITPNEHKQNQSKFLDGYQVNLSLK